MAETKKVLHRRAIGLELRDDSDDTGSVTARFATLEVPDSYDTIMARGAFGEQKVLLSGYNHAAWGTAGFFGGGVPGDAPVGRGSIREDGNEAIFEGEFWLDTDPGRNTYIAIKRAAELQEWSFGFFVLDEEVEERDGEEYERYTKIDVREVSPVIVGGGVNTGTIDIRGGERPDPMALYRELDARLENLERQAAAQRVREIMRS